MPREAIKNGGLLFNFQNFSETPTNATYSLSQNTALLAFLLVRAFGNTRSRWFYEEDQGNYQEFLGLEDSEWDTVQDWYEQALVELKTQV